MRSDKGAAIEMRRNGTSYAELHKRLKIPKATLSDWFGKKNWSVAIKLRLAKNARIKHVVRIRDLNKVRGVNLKKIYVEAHREADKDFAMLKYNPLFIAGLMLYWGEGDKRTSSQVRLTNTDPEMMRLFVFFLRKVCRIPKERIRGSVIIYPDLNPDICRKYWAQKTGIAEKYFTKCPVIQGRHPFRKLSNGICMAVVSSTYFKVKILRWLWLLPRELMSKKYYDSIGNARA